MFLVLVLRDLGRASGGVLYLVFVCVFVWGAFLGLMVVVL